MSSLSQEKKEQHFRCCKQKAEAKKQQEGLPPQYTRYQELQKVLETVCNGDNSCKKETAAVSEEEIAEVLDTVRQFQESSGNWGSCKALFDFVAKQNSFRLGTHKHRRFYRDGQVATTSLCAVDPEQFADRVCLQPPRK